MCNVGCPVYPVVVSVCLFLVLLTFSACSVETCVCLNFISVQCAKLCFYVRGSHFTNVSSLLLLAVVIVTQALLLNNITLLLNSTTLSSLCREIAFWLVIYVKDLVHFIIKCQEFYKT